MDPVRVQRTEEEEKGVWERAPHVVAPRQSRARSRSRTQGAPYARWPAPCLPGVGCEPCEARRSTPPRRGVHGGATAVRAPPCRACMFFQSGSARHARPALENASGGPVAPSHCIGASRMLSARWNVVGLNGQLVFLCRISNAFRSSCRGQQHSTTGLFSHMGTVRRTSRSARSWGVLVWSCRHCVLTAPVAHPTCWSRTEPVPETQAGRGSIQPRLPRTPPPRTANCHARSPTPSSLARRAPAVAIREPFPGPAPYIRPRRIPPGHLATRTPGFLCIRACSLALCSFGGIAD
jgi:hypothetical protein